MSVLFIFIDGLGIGDASNKDSNPLELEPNRIFKGLRAGQPVERPFDGIAIPTDAVLGVPGIPQSATGQTSLFTGINAQEKMGKHINAFPPEGLKKIIYERNILKDLNQGGFKVAFANVYQDLFFSEKRLRPDSVSTTLVRAAGLDFMRIKDLLQGRGIYQDFTNKFLQRLGYDVPEFTPTEAGKRLARMSLDYDLVLYEYFISDMVAHHRNKEMSCQEVRKLDEFVVAVLENTDLSRHSVVLSSDHGNLEDLTTREHTTNKVPTFLWGPIRSLLEHKISAITDITPGIIEFIGKERLRHEA